MALSNTRRPQAWMAPQRWSQFEAKGPDSVPPMLVIGCGVGTEASLLVKMAPVWSRVNL